MIHYLYAGANSRFIDVDAFGAVGDGSTDDSAAIQDALDAGDGSILRLTPGKTYNIGTQLDVDPTKIRGIQGNNAILKATADIVVLNIDGVHDTTANPVGHNAAQEYEQGFFIDHTKITNNLTDLNGTGIKMRDVMFVKIIYSHIYNMNVGIHVDVNARNLVISGNNIQSMDTYGIYLDADLHQINIENNHISYCDSAAIYNHGENYDLHDLQIVGNDIEGNTITTGRNSNYLIHLKARNTYDMYHTVISGNKLEGHNYLTGTTGACIYLDGRDVDDQYASGVTITGNAFASAPNGIRLKDRDYVTVSGNTFLNVDYALWGESGAAGRVDRLSMTGNSVFAGALCKIEKDIQYCIFTGNRVDRTEVGGIVLNNSSRNTIINGNSISWADTNSSEWAIRGCGNANQLTDVILTDNLVRSYYPSPYSDTGNGIKAASTGTVSDVIVAHNMVVGLDSAKTEYDLESAAADYILDNNLTG